MKLITLKDKLDSIGYDAALAALNQENDDIKSQYEEAQRKFAIALDKRGIASEDFYFNPEDSYIRLQDHSERRLHTNTWMCVDLVRASDTAMAMALEGIRFESQRYVQNVNPSEQNLIVCAETLEYFAELMRAFDDQTLVKDYIDIMNEYWAYVLSAAKQGKANYDIVELGKQCIKAAEYATTVLMPCGINTQEDAKEYFDSISGAELDYMWAQMGSPGEYSNKDKKLRETILEFFLLDETKS